MKIHGLSLVLPLFFIACADAPSEETGGGDVAPSVEVQDDVGGDVAGDVEGGEDAAAGGETEVGPEELGCVLTEPACQEVQTAEYRLTDADDGGEISNVWDEAGFYISHIDATAGGMNATQGFTYGKFTDEGLVRVGLGDIEALGSEQWDLAAQRFLLRLNSGVSGPSCVLGGRVPGQLSFDEVTSLPEPLVLREEQYYQGADCHFLPDTSGLGAAQTVISTFWSYPGCVQMTGNVYIVQLADGRHIKMEVLSYYHPEVQAGCDEDGSLTTPSGAGNLRIKWAFVDS